jgi:hypothetical protein
MSLLYNEKMPKVAVKKSPRLETLDHLRGFFIVVIIIDHLSRWPSLLSIFTGKALLWVTAAEGFVAISGLLVGYIRGYKNRDLPFKEVSSKLIKRGLLLYAWSLIASIAYVAIIWYIPLQGGFSSTPMARGDWPTFLFAIVTMQYTYVWMHFLTLYALFLVASPIAVWLFRRNLSWAVGAISFVLLLVGYATHIEALQWQFLFFIPSIVGLYLDGIMKWWKKLARATQAAIAVTTVGLTLATIIASTILTFYAQNTGYVNDVLFGKDSISLLRAGMAFLWFAGFFFVFYKLRRFISRFFSWLLIPIGTRSLTAYILHGLALCIISFFTMSGDNIAVNTALGVVAIMIVWTFLRIPAVQKVIPA